jgi:alpha-D-xyloside xylohydrolase
MPQWTRAGDAWRTSVGDATVALVSHPLAIRATLAGVDIATGDGDAYPAAPLAARRGGRWRAPEGAPLVAVQGEALHLTWADGAALVVAVADDGSVSFTFDATGADAVSFALRSTPDEHYYGMGERFNTLDQRGAIVELWVKNGASGGDTYKPVPFVASSRGYGVALDTTRRVHCSLAHATTPDIACFTVHGPRLAATLIPGPAPADVVSRYTARVGRPPAPPAWVFEPWKSRDWRVDTQEAAMDDMRAQRERGIACGVILIDAAWEAETHTFTFDPARWPDPAGLIRTAREHGMRVVLWVSPSLTLDTALYDEAAARGFLIRNAAGEPYVHRLGNEPGWEGTTLDFTHPGAVAWWQEKLRALLEMGVAGFKTDFGEQVPEDAIFADGRTGAELHNLLPVLYNRASWEVVREYGGILLARSAWAGSQPYPAVWAGDQSADFSPWAGLPTAIVAGQSAGWSGFPYWGSDIGGYFNAPDDDVFVRWAQFAALTPVMEVHGLGNHDPWPFTPETLEIYRRYANLHAQLAQYSRMAARIAMETGMPLMRAMALAFPDDPEVHEDWVQYQYLYGPDLLVAPVYSWATTRQVRFPAGEWCDFHTGTRYRGPVTTRVSAPMDTLPILVRAGGVVALRRDPLNADDPALDLLVYPGGATERTLTDGTRIALDPAGATAATLAVRGADRAYTLRLPGMAGLRVREDGEERRVQDGIYAWQGDALLNLTWE